jgi:hypothetical protein
MLKVLPVSEEMLKHLKHPSGMKFTTMDTPVEWPNDQFTMRRVIEGVIKVVGETPDQPVGPPPLPQRANKDKK